MNDETDREKALAISQYAELDSKRYDHLLMRMVIKLTLEKMTYKNFQFMTNPEKIKIKYSKTIPEQKIINGWSITSETTKNAKIISGSGKIFGSDYLVQTSLLSKIQKEENEGWLFLPNSEPIIAFFKELIVSFDAKNKCANYEFVFVELPNNTKSEYDFGYTYVLDGENLFDVANRTNVCVDELMKLNEFMTPFDISVGNKVVLK